MVYQLVDKQDVAISISHELKAIDFNLIAERLIASFEAEDKANVAAYTQIKNLLKTNERILKEAEKRKDKALKAIALQQRKILNERQKRYRHCCPRTGKQFGKKSKLPFVFCVMLYALLDAAKGNTGLSELIHDFLNSNPVASPKWPNRSRITGPTPEWSAKWRGDLWRRISLEPRLEEFLDLICRSLNFEIPPNHALLLRPWSICPRKPNGQPDSEPNYEKEARQFAKEIGLKVIQSYESQFEHIISMSFGSGWPAPDITKIKIAKKEVATKGDSAAGNSIYRVNVQSPDPLRRI